MKNKTKLDEEFSLLVKLNMKRAYFSALAFLGNHDLAMDASQEAFVKAYQNFAKFDQSKKFFTWYFKILKNLCLNMLRDNKKFETIDMLEERMSDSQSIPLSMEDKEMKHLMQMALFKLNAIDRGILILREFEDFSYKEISEIMEIPIGTVMSKIYNARKKLYSNMEGKL
ncbi:MAG: RNA polymerase sigma factor [Melioribacteraceae bacterium]|nr:MAG: RNA polymerase sigma factor [Melioribacteraceae bacterium]